MYSRNKQTNKQSFLVFNSCDTTGKVVDLNSHHASKPSFSQIFIRNLREKTTPSIDLYFLTENFETKAMATVSYSENKLIIIM